MLHVVFPHHCMNTISSCFTGVPARQTLTALTGTGIMLLLACPAIRDERKMRAGDQVPSFPAASIREEPQGLLDHCEPAAVPSGRMTAEDEGCTCKVH